MNTSQYKNESSAVQVLDLGFESLYSNLREREKRVYTDDELRRLPDIDSSHIHFKEWQSRKYTSQKLIAYLVKAKRPLEILEIGCGNGWLSSKLSSIKGSRVIGLDMNEVEIEQAKRVFKRSNLQFIQDSFRPEMFCAVKFDIILFAASIQYFSKLTDVLGNALQCLAANGEIHIMDTPFYNPDEIDGAAQRAKNYFASLGCLEMAAYYFHHPLNNLKQFNYKVLRNPVSLINRILRRQVFYWIAVTH